MRVLHVSEVSWGGVVSLLVEFCAQQVARGDEVHLLAPPALRAPEGVQGHRWDLNRRHPLGYPRSLLQYHRTLAQVAPDVVHLHSFVAGLAGRLPRISGDVPVVYQPHAWSFDLYPDRRFRRFVESWERFADRRTDMLVANCADEIAEGRQVGVTTPAEALGVALDIDAFRPVAAEQSRKHYEALDVSTSRVVLCLGRLARQKGQDQLVQAWERSPLPDTTLLLAGPGDWTSLRHLAPTQWDRTVCALPEASDVRPLLWAADLLVLPSRYETVAVVIAEAMACGRPVVATAVNGVTEAVLDGPEPPAGAVVPLGAMDRLLIEAGRRLDDADLLARESQAARERAHALFAAPLVVDRLGAAYVRAVGNRGVPA
jgi:glycosyltransferase involved in cell wall biosynthesis